MPLSTAEIAQLHEIVGLGDYTAADISDLAALLTDDQLTLVRADLAEWGSLKTEHTALKGGRDGIEIDPVRARNEIASRNRRRLGIASASPGGLYWIPIGSAYS